MECKKGGDIGTLYYCYLGNDDVMYNIFVPNPATHNTEEALQLSNQNKPETISSIVILKKYRFIL